jgi:hypothetical protein
MLHNKRRMLLKKQPGVNNFYSIHRNDPLEQSVANAIAPNPALTLTRLSLRSRLREGAAKNPCQRGFGSFSPGRLRPR